MEVYQLYLILIFFCSAESFVLEGSPTSYAQFEKWCTSLNSTFSFEFQTEEPNGLLMYTDDGGIYDFYELKLVEGALRLRFNLGGGATMLTVGRNLHDSQWHRVEVIRSVEETVLRVDNETERHLSKSRELVFGNQSTNSYVYLGGIPSWYNTKLNLLALPSVFFEPRFKGAIRNVVYCSGSGSVKRQEMISFKGVRSSQFDVCEHSDPCQNGGICISTDSGAICNCKAIDYEGTYCEKEKIPSEVTFSGTEILQYDLRGTGGEPVVSMTEVISLYFKTRQSGGMLFYTGNRDDFLNLSLRGGGLVVTVRLGSGTLEKIIRPGRVRFDDNQWHQVMVHRHVREITPSTGFCYLTLTADSIYTEKGSTAGSFSSLSSSLVYLGGTELTSGLRGRNNFVGCLRKVEFLADSILLDLIEMAKTNNKLVQHHGSVLYFCKEVETADPITFTTKESFLVLPTWEGSKSGSLNMRFRTNEPNSVLLYNSGNEGDYFALELLDGHVFLLLNLGSGTKKVQATSKRVSDGQWHLLTLRRTGKSGRINVDESAVDFSTPGNANQLDLRGPLYLGGVALNEQLPSEMWAGKLLYGYVGCIKNLVINSKPVDLSKYAKQQDSGSIRPSCHAPPNHCDSQPCLNGGNCIPGWNRFSCDCSLTDFAGPICAKAAVTLNFDGEQFMKIVVAEEYQSQAEDIGLRFRTTHPNGLLFTTQSNKFNTYVIALLESGRIKVIANLGDGNKVIFVGHRKNDDQWHRFWFKRRGFLVEVTIDTETVGHELIGRASLLDIEHLYVGSIFGDFRTPAKDITAFVGQMQHFYFNGRHYFEMARSGQISNFQLTAKFGKKEAIVHHPVTFKSKYTYIGLPQLKAYFLLNLYFQFKTLEPNGLILFNKGRGNDYLAMELYNGHLYCIFNLGDGTRKMKSNTQNPLNDNAWHSVTVSRLLPTQHTMVVDDVITTLTSSGANIHLDLDGILYFGGVRRSMYHNLPQPIHSQHGFEGCIASVDMMGETIDLMQDAIIPSTLVSKGCSGPVVKCSVNACANGGVCVQMWNSYTCDCDMTSFSGPTCSDESIAYEFGPGTGLLTFTYPQDNQPDTKSDLLALGFITMSRNAVLVRIESGSSNDYMELEIVDGSMFVVYNVGTEDHPIGEPRVRVNDGQYHVLRFTRSGPNSTIQIDDHNIRSKNPPGPQRNVFDNHSKIQIGGRKNAVKDAIDRPFQGVITGLVFNGQRILDMTAEDDPRIKIEGDVELLMSLPLNMQQQRSIPAHTEMQQQPSTPIESDDLVFSGAGSGCYDDEDECGVEEFGSGDDLITPVFIPPTPKPTPTTTTTTPKPTFGRPSSTEDMVCDDEEDCMDSGSGVEEMEIAVPLPPKVHVPGIETKITEIKSSPRPQYITVPSTVIEPPIERPSVPQRPSYTTTIPSPVESTTRLTPEIYGVPIPELPSSGKDQPKPHQKTKSSADNTALVIGIIAGILIFIVFIALIVYSVCRRSLGAYKIDEGKSLQYPPAVSEPPVPPPTAIPQTHMNGSVKAATKLAKKKDLKEWYV